MTGILTNSKKNVWTCVFDASDPTINFVDGTYPTEIVIKKNSLITYAAIKFLAYTASIPTGDSIDILVLSTLAPNITINQDTFTHAAPTPTLNVFSLANNFVSALQVSPLIGTNPNNDFVYVAFVKAGGSTLTALKFEIYLEITDMDV
jgi:hypothetical protein